MAANTHQSDLSQPVSVSARQQTSLAADASPSSPDVLRTLYSVLLKSRLLEEQVLVRRHAGWLVDLDTVTLGGEATEVGACIGLQPGDSFSSSRNSFAVPVVRNTPLEEVFSEPVGSPRSPQKAETASFHVIPRPSTITGQLNLAAGVALAYRQLGKYNVVVVLAEDGLAALGFWHEAASLASSNRLPIVFMVENPAEPKYVSRSFPSDEDLRDRAEAYRFPGITVDGNDLVAVWRVTQESMHRARSGSGPTLIECRTWRWPAEGKPRSANGTRSNAPMQHDPLLHMQHYMKKRNLWDQRWHDSLTRTYKEYLNRASRIPGGRI